MVLCPVQYESIDIDAKLRSMLLSTFVLDVSNTAPVSKLEFERWNKYWPIIFHPDERERQLSVSIANNQINVLQSKFRDIMNECVALDASKLDALGWLGGAVIVNPVNNEVWMSCQV